MRINFKVTQLSFFVLWCLFFPLFSCSDYEPAKKVSLKKIHAAPQIQPLLSDTTGFRFGFDLRLGPKEDVRIYMPFLKYLEQQSGREFVIRFTESYEDTVDNLGRGITQFAALGPVNAIIARERYNIDCLVMGLNESGKPEYRSAIIVRAGSPIQSLEELRGRTFAFGDRLSTQGHVIPRKMLEDSGLKMPDLKAFIYSGSHANTARAVLNGLYDAGGIQDTLAKRLLAEGKIRILAESKAYPSSLICYNRAVPKEVVASVKKALIDLDPQGKQKAMLPGWEKTEMPAGFMAFDGRIFDEIRTLAKRYGLTK